MATNIEKNIGPGGPTPSDLDPRDQPDMLDVELPDLDDVDFELVGEEPDGEGGVIIDFDPGADAAEEAVEHDANLAEYIEEGDLQSIGSDLRHDYDVDKQSRRPWEQAYIKGLKLLGLEIEERDEPWAGASGVFHPILTEAVIRFQADAMAETFPAAGPVNTKIVGKITTEREKQSKRIRDDMNYHCTTVIPEYRQEHEQALFQLAISGSIFKKVYFDHSRQLPTSRFIPADDFVVSYGTSDLTSCPRATHVMKMYPNDVLRAQLSGQYLPVDIPKPATQYSDVDRAESDAANENPSAETDERHTLLEMHVELDLPGFEHTDDEGEPTGLELPYVVTLDRDSGKVLAIRRNWKEDSPTYEKVEFFIHYPYLPGLGFYGIGLVHLLGGIAKSATSILRQLIDAGTIANLPAGLKARGLRIKGDNTPLRPGEFRDVDVPGGAIKDSITFVPHKEPSAVLYNLLGTLTQDGRQLASITDMKVSEMSTQAPVGTTLAVLERGMKVMSGVHARIHAAMYREFQLLAALIRDHSPKEYEYDTGEDEQYTREEDYDDRVDIIPVSNPNAATMSQRIMQHQAALQLSAQDPSLYDRRKLHRRMLGALGIEDADEIVPLEEEMIPTDPVSENMQLLTGKPVKAHPHQDHESHLAVHMALAQDPKLQELMAQNPNGKAIQAAAAAHLQEHVAFQYRREIEKQLGVPLPAFGEEIPPEVEVQLSKLAADAADKLLRKDVAEKQAQKNAEAQNDPVLQLQKADAETKRKEVERKARADELRAETSRAQIASKEKQAGAKFGFEVQKELLDKEMELAELRLEMERLRFEKIEAGTKLGMDMAADLAGDGIERERIASQERIAELREKVNVVRMAQDRTLEEERLANERQRDTQNFATQFANSANQRGYEENDPGTNDKQTP